MSIYLETEKAIKHLPMSMSVCADKALLNSLYVRFGRDNVQVVEKKIEKPNKR